MKKFWTTFAAALITLFCANGSAFAQSDLRIKVAELTMTVEILETEFDRQRIETVTTWTGDEKTSFEGPYLLDVLKAAGLEDNPVITIAALNGYSAEVPLDVIKQFNPVLAVRQDGDLMPRRRKGPAWLVFPRSDFGEEISNQLDSMWVWSVESIQ